MKCALGADIFRSQWHQLPIDLTRSLPKSASTQPRTFKKPELAELRNFAGCAPSRAVLLEHLQDIKTRHSHDTTAGRHSKAAGVLRKTAENHVAEAC